MIKIESSLGDIYLSRTRLILFGDVERISKDDSEELVKNHIEDCFMFRKEHREYCELYAKKIGQKGFVFLEATHGGEDNDEWVYYDGKEKFSVQNWIKKMDGKYGTITIHACNTEVFTPRAKKSLLLLPNSIVCGHPNAEDFDLIHPKKGVIDDYIINYELSRLEREVQHLSPT